VCLQDVDQDLAPEVVEALPMNDTGADVSSALSAFAHPSWLTGVATSVAGWFAHHGTTVVVLVVVEATIGLAALHRKTVANGAIVGLVAAAIIWVFGQDFGQLYTGQATDPNTAPLLAVMAMALLAGRPVGHREVHRSTSEPLTLRTVEGPGYPDTGDNAAAAGDA
jgi:hypothetical protein